jgi:hypothetical protein
VTTAARVPMLPETSAIGEFVPGYEASFRIGAPRNTLASWKAPRWAATCGIDTAGSTRSPSTTPKVGDRYGGVGDDGCGGESSWRG